MCHFNADKKVLVAAWRLHQYHTLKGEKIKQGAFIDADQSVAGNCNDHCITQPKIMQDMHNNGTIPCSLYNESSQ